jgi:glycosyltransferase involved in cell wall biosynthesis
MAIQIRNKLRESRVSEIYAHFLDPSAASEVHPIGAIPSGRARDLLIYHASYGAPEVTSLLRNRPERLVLAYHNITPSHHFVDHSPHFALGLEWGRHELKLLHNQVALTIADSRFNAEDLVDVGYTNVHVVPAGLRPNRLRSVPPEPRLARELRTAYPNGYVLALSQVLPHKRFDTIVEAMHLLQWVHQLDVGLVIVGATRLPSYAEALHRLAHRLQVQNMRMAGAVDDRQLATYLRMAAVYVTTSAHEGLALPPLEAMSFSVPVVARCAGAIAETVSYAGLLLPAGCGPMLVSEAVAEVIRNEGLRRQLVGAGLRRVQEIDADDPAERFVELVAGIA